MQEDEDQMWLKPNVDVGDISSIWEYALTVDGYGYAKANLGVECGDLGNQKLETYERYGTWQGSFQELRCCLFFEQRRWHQLEQTQQVISCWAYRLSSWLYQNAGISKQEAQCDNQSLP